MKSDPQFLQTLQVGGATNSETGGKSAYYFMQVGGPQHSEIGSSISTNIASWRGHKLRNWWKVSLK
ncbi:TPA: hypothetical protein O4743_002340 [Staphylococcus aureus]|nr:hypothetical protein [Staphylococcus aureus]